MNRDPNARRFIAVQVFPLYLPFSTLVYITDMQNFYQLYIAEIANKFRVTWACVPDRRNHCKRSLYMYGCSLALFDWFQNHKTIPLSRGGRYHKFLLGRFSGCSRKKLMFCSEIYHTMQALLPFFLFDACIIPLEIDLE